MMNRFLKDLNSLNASRDLKIRVIEAVRETRSLHFGCAYCQQTEDGTGVHITFEMANALQIEAEYYPEPYWDRYAVDYGSWEPLRSVERLGIEIHRNRDSKTSQPDEFWYVLK